MNLLSRRNIVKAIVYSFFAGITPSFMYGRNNNVEAPCKDFEPGYLRLHRSGELKRRGEELWAMMESCELCPRMCGVNKLKGEKGLCQANSQLEMHRQVGVAKPADNGLMYRGLMIRHLVMPNDVSGTRGVIDWIANNLPKDTYLNIMSQYSPMYKAYDYPEISRKITHEEYSDAVSYAKAAGLTNLEIQGYRFF